MHVFEFQRKPSSSWQFIRCFVWSQKEEFVFFVVVANFIYKLEIVIAQTSIIVLQINCSAVFISFVNDIHGSFLKKEKQNFSKEIHFAICVRMSVNRSFLLFIPLSLSLIHFAIDIRISYKGNNLQSRW